MSSKKNHSYIIINIPPNSIVKFGETDDIIRRRNQLDAVTDIVFIPLIENKENTLKEEFKEEHKEKEKYNLTTNLLQYINGELEAMFFKLLGKTKKKKINKPVKKTSKISTPKKKKRTPIPKSNRAKSSGSPITSQWSYRYYIIEGKKTKYVVRKWKGKIEKIKI